jgi:tetratricopeptide (TPR) repeat protein
MKVLVSFALCCAAAIAQHAHPAAAPGEKPVALYPGLGIWTHPIATRNPQAQKFFDQGLALLYGFNRYEALRSFRKALELDPQAAMAQWGVAMALGPYINMDLDPDVHTKDACDAAAAGLRITGTSGADRAWLEAAESRCPDYSDSAKYIAAMRALAAQYPDDPDAQTFYAESLMLPARWRWYGPDGKPADGVAEAERVLEGVLRRYPNHPGANHLYIHAVESSPVPERAVPSAQRLMGIMPSAGHMVHMPGHIWLVLGEFNTAVDVNQRAAAVDREYFAKTGVMGSYYMYYLHNLQFIVYARSMQGRSAETRKAIAAIREAGRPLAQAMPEMAGIVNIIAAMAQLRIGDWDGLLAALQPAPADAPGQAMWRYARGISLAAKGKPGEARAEQIEFEKVRRTLDRSVPFGSNKLGDVMDLASAVLDARLEASPAAAAGKWRRAVEIQDGLAYDEPPAWYYPVRESLGAALLRAGDAAAAETVFREGLRRSPRNGRLLFGLAESLKAQRKTEAAAWVHREFLAAWNGADIPLRVSDL